MKQELVQQELVQQKLVQQKLVQQEQEAWRQLELWQQGPVDDNLL